MNTILQAVILLSTTMSSFNITNNKDHKLQERCNEYFAAFCAQDVDRLMKCLTDDFVMDDFRKHGHTFLFTPSLSAHGDILRFILFCFLLRPIPTPHVQSSRPFPALGLLNISREAFRGSCTRQFSVTEDIQMGCLSLDGSSEPGSFAALQWIMNFKLKAEIPALAPGVKVGERATLVGVSCLWWGENGKVKKQAEHGRPLWPGFDIELARRMI